ncbi:hypothetical protein SAMN05421754_101631 [Nitrosomonas sp. Nm58]|jgi:hypothetical protein|nr:hypothetical protein SAMN05421754_101631 [Nitrosomonas sp. Nm58]
MFGEDTVNAIHQKAGQYNHSAGGCHIYSSHFKIWQLYLLPLGEGRMRDDKNRILKCDEYNGYFFAVPNLGHLASNERLNF